MTKKTEIKVAVASGLCFLVVLLVIAFACPNPTDFQYTVFRIILALAVAAVATVIPGALEIAVPNWLRAGGALGVFVIVYFYSPAKLAVHPPGPPAIAAINHAMGNLRSAADKLPTDFQATKDIAKAVDDLNIVVAEIKSGNRNQKTRLQEIKSQIAAISNLPPDPILVTQTRASLEAAEVQIDNAMRRLRDSPPRRAWQRQSDF